MIVTKNRCDSPARGSDYIIMTRSQNSARQFAFQDLCLAFTLLQLQALIGAHDSPSTAHSSRTPLPTESGRECVITARGHMFLALASERCKVERLYCGAGKSKTVTNRRNGRNKERRGEGGEGGSSAK